MKADIHASVGDRGIGPKTTRAQPRSRVGTCSPQPGVSAAPCWDPDEVEYGFLPMLPASNCTSGSTNIMGIQTPGNSPRAPGDQDIRILSTVKGFQTPRIPDTQEFAACPGRLRHPHFKSFRVPQEFAACPGDQDIRISWTG